MRFLPTRKSVAEMVGGLRDSFSFSRRSLWSLPSYRPTEVNVLKTRQLYRNDDPETSLGSGFSRPIIDTAVEFIGFPYSASGDARVDTLLDLCIHKYWGETLQQAIRDSLRDTTTVVRYRKASAGNPLVDAEEISAGYLEIVPPETVTIFYDKNDATLVERVIIRHEVEQLLSDQSTPFAGGGIKEPRTETHVIFEEITASEYTYWDETKGEFRDDLNKANPWGFVPIVEFFNEYEAYLKGGQSDLEPSYVFIRAFHDVLAQTLTAHKQHATPKAKFKLQAIEPFLMNNFPDAFQTDENGQAVSGTFSGEISWKGMEVFFLNAEEDIAFVEAQNTLDGSDALLRFLLECIVISSETPKWAFGLDVGAADKTESLVFTRKVDRKRVNFTPYIQQVCKMALVTNGIEPMRVPFEWAEVDPDTLVTETQALNQYVASIELLTEKRLISDETARRSLRRFIKGMKAPDDERRAAESNFLLSQLTRTPNSPVPQNGNQGAPITGRAGQGGRNE